jgi:hypothetical protein
MSRTNCFRLVLLTAVLTLFALRVAARQDDKQPTVEPRDRWSNVFGGQSLEFRYTVKAGKAWKGRAIWSLASENDRTLASGEADVTADAGKPVEFTVKLEAPEVKPGIVLKTRLRVQILAGGVAKPDATHHRALWVFSQDPFANRKEWLKGLKIALFDPEKSTAGPLKKLAIPFDEIDSVPALGAVKEGLLLVGSGVSFKDYPDLVETLSKAAANGLPVLCLAPAGGTMPAPGTARKAPRAQRVAWRRADHITTLDARLDATAWREGKVVTSTLTLKAEDGVVVAEAGTGEDGWPWLEAEFPTKKGHLIVCGFGLIGKAWEAGPTPRYLFARILEVLSEKKEKLESPQDKETIR